MAVLASDNFTGTDGTAWSGTTWTTGSSPTGSSALIQGNVGRLTTGTGTAGSARVARRVNITAPVDAVALFKFRWPTGDECYPRFYIRSTNTSLDTQGGYFVELNRPGGNYSIAKGTAYSSTTLPTGTAADVIAKSFSANTWYWVRFGVVGSTIRARIWNDGVSEPTAWDLTATDTTHTTANSGAGLTLGTGSIQNGKFEIDDFSLDSAFPVTGIIGPTATTSGTAPAGTVSAGAATVGVTTSTSSTAVSGTVAATFSIVGTPTTGFINAIAGEAGVGAFLDGNPASATAIAQPGNYVAGITMTAPGPATGALTALAGTPSIPVWVDGVTVAHTVTAPVGTVVGERDNIRVGSANVRVRYRDFHTGIACRGYVRFTPTAYISSDDLLIPNRVAVPLVDGLLDVDLPVGKDQLTLPLVAYYVEELLEPPSVGRKPFYLLLTPADDGSIVDLAAVSMEFEVPDLSLYMLKAGGEFTGPVAIASTLDVTGNTTLGANLAVVNMIEADSIVLEGSADIGGSATVTGTLDVEGALSAGQVTSPAYSGGDMTGDLDITGNLHVSEDTVIDGNLTIDDNLSVVGTVVGPLKLDEGTLSIVAGALTYTGGNGTVTTVAPA